MSAPRCAATTTDERPRSVPLLYHGVASARARAPLSRNVDGAEAGRGIAIAYRRCALLFTHVHMTYSTAAATTTPFVRALVQRAAWKGGKSGPNEARSDRVSYFSSSSVRVFVCCDSFHPRRSFEPHSSRVRTRRRHGCAHMCVFGAPSGRT